jgi:hypothetical protein
MSEAKLKARITRLEAERLVTEAGVTNKEHTAQLAEKIIPNLQCEIGADGDVKTILVDPESGKEMWITPAQLVGLLEKEHPHLFVKKPVPVAPAPEIENPWTTGNLTQQGAISKNNPTLAHRLKADAKRGTPADNPFSKEGFNLSMQSKLLRDDPALAARMRAEVAGPEPNPWKTETFNLTRQVLISRSDKIKADRMKAEAEASNPPKKKDYRFIPPPGAFRRRVPVESEK